MKEILDLKKAIEGLEGIPIPFNIIKQCINPLMDWVNQAIKEDFDFENM